MINKKQNFNPVPNKKVDFFMANKKPQKKFMTNKEFTKKNISSLHRHFTASGFSLPYENTRNTYELAMNFP
jgi:hypothetical protein